jgi:hypothetical protein
MDMPIFQRRRILFNFKKIIFVKFSTYLVRDYSLFLRMPMEPREEIRRIIVVIVTRYSSILKREDHAQS